MKSQKSPKILITLLLLISSVAAFAQAPPQAISYQAVARDNNGNIISNKTVSLRFIIHDATAAGTTVYEETQPATTNVLGLVNLSVGTGTVVSGTFAGINWGSGPKYLEVDIDPTGGANYTALGTSQMLSVPYALYATSSGGLLGQSYSEVYGTSSLSIGVTTYTLIPGLTTTINVPANSIVKVHSDGGVQDQSTEFDAYGFTEVEVALFVDGNPPTAAPTSGNGGYKVVTALDNTPGFGTGEGVYDNFTYFSIDKTYDSAVLGVGNHTFSVKTEWDLGTDATVSGGVNSFLQGVLTVTIIKK